MFLPQEFIRKKRDRQPLAAAEIAAFMRGVVDGSVTDSQISAFAMAVYFNDLSVAERVALTHAQRDSGRVLDWRALQLNGPVIDKHSTGGVGDLTSLLLGPMIAACGGYVPMISGRGLGHTGGTLDKLNAIPGYDTTPDTEGFQRVVRDVGVAIIGQTDELAPADRRIYAVRDVTATVESIALITSSILSKKLAAGLNGLVMDVKAGSGAFMPTLDASVALAQSIVDVGNGAGMKTVALITGMDEPLAPCAGNALEILCAIDYLTGKSRPARLHEVTVSLAAQMLIVGGLCNDENEARAKLQAVLDSGEAAQRFASMVAALGGPGDLLEAPLRHLDEAPVCIPVPAPVPGKIQRIDCRALGLAVVGLGGGRRRPQDPIDYAVGLSAIEAIGQTVDVGQPICFIHARTAEAAQQAASAVVAAYTIGAGDAMLPPTIHRFVQ